MKMKSVMKHQFSQVPKANIPRSVFNRDHGYKTTFDAGYLIPFFVDEALPGDTFNVRATIFARLATPITPFMDNLFLDTFFFFVPNRLLWENWQRFCGEQDAPEDSTDFMVPVVQTPSGGWPVGGMADYFGLPTGIPALEASALPFRAYQLIYNQWFRDQNLQDPVTFVTGDGPDPNAYYALKKRGKRHDYFTSALPWPQKGPGVELPLGESAPLKVDGYEATHTIKTVYSGAINHNLLTAEPSSPQFSTYPEIYADLSEATAATINSLRQAFQMQRLYERDARGGSRYTEIVRSHFGVVSPDARLQRPEFLGGGSTPIMLTPVAQTSETNSTPQGNLSAFGTAGTRGDGFTKSFTEHGIIIGLLSVRADLTYQQGLPRMFSRRTRWDFYWPALAHLGEQAVLNKEIYAQGSAVINPATSVAYDEEVFGYQERWAEYRYYPSKITGKLRSTYATPLDMWHLSQEFTALPTLSDTFIQENPPMERVLAVNDEPHFIMDSYINCKTVRPMPVYSVPGLIDHF